MLTGNLDKVSVRSPEGCMLNGSLDKVSIRSHEE